jgi:hypothetical protein
LNGHGEVGLFIWNGKKIGVILNGIVVVKMTISAAVRAGDNENLIA